MGALAVILICLVTGLLFRATGAVPVTAAHGLNRVVIFLSLPAIVLTRIHDLHLDRGVFVPVLMPWMIFIVAVIAFATVRKFTGWSRGTTGALTLTAGLGNTSFVGFALLTVLFGDSALETGVLVDQPGTFLILSTVGIATAAAYAGKSVSARSVFRKVFTFPPFLALLAAFALRGWDYPEWLRQTLDLLGGTLIPLALVSVGLQLRLSPALLRSHWKPLAAGLGFKLFIAPALIALTFGGFFPEQGYDSRTFQIIIAEAAMAPMITAGIVATEYDLNPELASLMVGIGIPLSLLTVPAWIALLP